jgi:hypothetical protein
VKGFPQVMLFPASDKKKFIEIDRRPSVDNIAKFVKENSKLEFELAEFEKEAEAMQKRAIARVAFELKEKALMEDVAAKKIEPEEEDFEL